MSTSARQHKYVTALPCEMQNSFTWLKLHGILDHFVSSRRVTMNNFSSVKQ